MQKSVENKEGGHTEVDGSHYEDNSYHRWSPPDGIYVVAMTVYGNSRPKVQTTTVTIKAGAVLSDIVIPLDIQDDPDSCYLPCSPLSALSGEGKNDPPSGQRRTFAVDDAEAIKRRMREIQEERNRGLGIGVPDAGSEEKDNASQAQVHAAAGHWGNALNGEDLEEAQQYAWHFLGAPYTP